MVGKNKENIGLDRIFTKKIGFTKEQHNALNGMGIMLPRSTLFRLRKKDAVEITRKVREELAPAVLAQCADFSTALSTESKRDILDSRLQLIKNCIMSDIRIGEDTGDSELIEFAEKERMAFEDMTSEIVIKPIVKTGVKSPSQPPQHLDSSI